MAKKGWGKFVAFAAVTGAVAAGVSYVLQYKTYHKELEKDFREFEDSGDEDRTERKTAPLIPASWTAIIFPLLPVRMN